jgi:uncharacterized membrane protein YqjE
MAKTMCIILGLAFLALGLMGLTGLVPMFTSNPVYVNIGEIVLGVLGLLFGIFPRQGTNNDQKSKDFARQTKKNAERQRKQLEDQIHENEQMKKQNN